MKKQYTDKRLHINNSYLFFPVYKTVKPLVLPKLSKLIKVPKGTIGKSSRSHYSYFIFYITDTEFVCIDREIVENNPEYFTVVPEEEK